MAYRKLKADKIFDGFRFHEEKVLVIEENGIIASIENSQDIQDAEQHTGILLPGFINAHCHLELSHMKGLVPEGTGLVDFVAHVVVERHAPGEVIAKAIKKGVDELLHTGTVAVGDICNNISTIPEKKEGRLQYHNFIEVSGWSPEVADSRMEHSLQLSETFKAADLQRSLSPHAPYSVSDSLWNLLFTHFTAVPVTIHSQESPHENNFFISGTGDFGRLYTQMGLDNSHHQPPGITSVQHYFQRLLHARRRLLVHNTFTSSADIDHVRSFGADVFANTFFCICPNANLYIERSLPPVELLQAHGCAIVIGTDSLASNHALSIPSELKVLHEHFPNLAVEDLLRWATINGARAMGMDDKLGSFEKGKQPGVVVLDPATWEVSRVV